MWSPWNTLGRGFVGGAVLLSWPLAAAAAELPVHDPLRILIISDEVNPHGLSPDQLTQPGDLSAAIGSPDSGIAVELVDEVQSECIDDALALLGGEGADAIVYFAHLPATACDGSPRQEELTAAMEAHLRERGGIVAFHHGIYEAGGKEAVLQLLGGRASSISWDTQVGQDVIAVAGSHFVTSQAMQYEGMRTFQGLGLPADEYPYFNNTPDERYEAMALLTTADEERAILFTSTDVNGGSPRVLGYDLWRPGWMGHVVFYQPGEYEPTSLDPSGNNFQVLANALLYVATTQEEPGDIGGSETGGMEPEEDTGSADGSGGTSDPAPMTTGGVVDEGDGTMTDTDAGQEATQAGESGCGCRSSGGGTGALGLSLLVLGLASRRRRSA